MRSVHAPLLIVHSTEDELFPVAMAQRVHAAANEPKRLVLVDGVQHNGMLEGKAEAYLRPVIKFLNEGPQKNDTYQ